MLSPTDGTPRGLSQADAVATLQAVGRGLADPVFLARLVALLTKHGMACPTTPKLREWQIETARHLKRQGLRRADLRLVLIHRFDLGRDEAERLMELAESPTRRA